MKRNRLIFGLALLLFATLVGWFWPRSQEIKPPESDPTTSLSSQEVTPELQAAEDHEARQEEKKKEIIGGIVSALNTPIEFYGKVVDQYGEPVPNARVGYSLLDKFNASGSSNHKFTDNVGHFEISGVRGAVITVKTTKDGYYQIPDVSYQSFAFGVGSDTYTKPPPTKDNPAVFVLHKMGETEPLIMFDYRSFRIPKDGTPVVVDLETGRVSNTGQLKVEAWTGERDPNGPRFYDWKCRVSVPGGGVIEREGQFDFEAPAEGYREFDEIVMPKDAERWSPDSEKSYFLRLANGHYARISFMMIAQGDHFFRLESFLNPKSGSRNLEYDAKQTVKAP